MNAKVTGVFPERHRAVTDWRKELFALYKVGQPVMHFVQAGMSHAFKDPKGFKWVETVSQMLDHVCWDVTGGDHWELTGGSSPSTQNSHNERVGI
jgi:hypothetical protein